MKKPDVGTTLGKCVFDNGVIVEGQSIRSQYATLRSGRWICGECLLDMLPTALEATESHMIAEAEKKEKLIAQVKQYGWSVNPTTGKLEKL
tara:strand:+ start:2946 stop:3218 length:273 start_codon:yes stop_codon:yes gene_type:complete